MFLRILLFIIILFMLSGCYTLHPYFLNQYRVVELKPYYEREYSTLNEKKDVFGLKLVINFPTKNVKKNVKKCD